MCSVRHVKQMAHLLRPHNKGIPSVAGDHQRARRFHRIQEARACRAHVHHGDIRVKPQRAVHEAGRAGHDVFPGAGGDQQAADLAFANPRALKRHARGLYGQRRGGFSLRAEIALADAPWRV